MGRRYVPDRRDADVSGYVDLYHPLLLLVLISIALLSVADAYLTLKAISRGCRELNPLMDAALKLGNQPFVAIKTGVTGLGVILLCLHKSYPRVRCVILFVLVCYIGLIAYQIINSLF